jgi:curved DNA-binding protein CbpA
MSEVDHYAVLQVDRRARPEVVQAAFEVLRELLLREDPDDALRQLVALNAAHAVLSDPERRAEYDRALSP